MAEKPLISNSQKPRSVNPALMQSQLDQARKRNQQSLNQIRQQQLGNQVELDKIKQQQLRTKRANERSLTGVDLYRQNNPINDPRAIENTLNQQRETARENPNQDQKKINEPENTQNFNQVENYNSQNAVGADREAGEQSREARIGELKTSKKEGDASISETETPQTQEPQAQENNLAEKKSQAINIPGIGGPGGGMSADDLQEVTKKAIKELAKKKLIMLLAPWAPVIITVLVGGLVTIVIIFASINVYQCYEKKGITGLLWSTFWKGYRQTLSDAFSGNCIAEDTPQQETTKKETPSQTTPPPEEGETP